MKLFFSVVPVCLFLDAITKYWAHTLLRLLPGGMKTFIPGVLEFRYAENTGAAFSMFSDSTWLVPALTLLLMVAVASFIVFYKDTSSAVKLALWAVFAGGVGNFINRIILGYVVDFINPVFIRFAIFNVADICITLGAICAGALFLFQQNNTVSGSE